MPAELITTFPYLRFDIAVRWTDKINDSVV